MTWIKASEQLPTEDQYVLTYAKDHRPRVQLGFYSTFSQQWVKTSTRFVEYWMEIPEPPKEK